MIQRALSLRVIFWCLAGGVGFGVVAQLVLPWLPLMPAVWTIAAGLYVLALLNDRQMTSCDACGKMVKLGAVRCHHCGYQRSAS